MSTPDQSHPELPPARPSRSESGVHAIPPRPPSGNFDRDRWDELERSFDADPVGALREADALVRKQIHALVNRLTQIQSRLHLRWEGRGEPSLDEMRACFREYRQLAQELSEQLDQS